MLTADPDMVFVTRTTGATRFHAAVETNPGTLERDWKSIIGAWAVESFELLDADVPSSAIARWQERLLTRAI